jgi:ribosomal protein S18 acetylase RimI-like enzyme
VTVEVARDSTLRGSDRAAFERIYLDSFPASERQPVSQLVAELASGGRRFLVARQAVELVGFAIVSFPGRGIGYLEYLAVDRSLRSSGFGTELMTALRKLVSDEGATALVWEVEAEEAGPPDDRAARRRRVRFYERNGGTIVRCAPGYHTPDLTGGAPLEMQLMWLGVQPDAPQPEGSLLRWVVETLLTIGYGLDPDDPLVRSNIGGLVC